MFIYLSILKYSIKSKVSSKANISLEKVIFTRKNT